VAAKAVDRHGIAARIRALTRGPDTDDISAAALLGVDEFAFRRTIHETAPFPSPDVIAAVIREFGVDSTWLLTGEYDADSHRRVADQSLPELRRTIIDLLAPPLTDKSRTSDGSVKRQLDD
jgi:hypothetical protein